MVLTNLYDVLTHRMDFQWQVRLGIRDSICATVNFTQDAVDRLSDSSSETPWSSVTTPPT